MINYFKHIYLKIINYFKPIKHITIDDIKTLIKTATYNHPMCKDEEGRSKVSEMIIKSITIDQFREECRSEVVVFLDPEIRKIQCDIDIEIKKP